MMESLEELAGFKIRWPDAAESAFRKSSNWFENAHISEDPFERLYFMTEGYKLGADLMVEQAHQEPHIRDRVVCAVIFNYRQYLELSLKYLIASYGPRVGVEANWNTHDLSKLWIEFKKIIDHYGEDNTDSGIEGVARVVAEFAIADQHSYSYRYPVDKKGRPVSLEIQDLELDTLKNVIEGVETFFSACDGYLDSMEEYADW